MGRVNNPVCHYCQRRVPVRALVRVRDRLEVPEEWRLAFRTFVAHETPDGKACEGSGKTLAVARGFEPGAPSVEGR